MTKFLGLRLLEQLLTVAVFSLAIRSIATFVVSPLSVGSCYGPPSRIIISHGLLLVNPPTINTAIGAAENSGVINDGSNEPTAATDLNRGTTDTTSTNGGRSARRGRLAFAYRRVCGADDGDDGKDPRPADWAASFSAPSGTADAAAASLERVLDGQREHATSQAYIGTLDAWTVAANKARVARPPLGNTASHDNATDGDGDGSGRQKLSSYYGNRMEQVVARMERDCVTGATVDAYATVIHFYVARKEPYEALRILGRMEEQLQRQGERPREETPPSRQTQDEAPRLRRIQYNRVLQGLVAASASAAAAPPPAGVGDPSRLQVAVQLLARMCGRRTHPQHRADASLVHDVAEFYSSMAATAATAADDEDGDASKNRRINVLEKSIAPFAALLPAGANETAVAPDAKSFVTVLVPLLLTFHRRQQPEPQHRTTPESGGTCDGSDRHEEAAVRLVVSFLRRAKALGHVSHAGDGNEFLWKKVAQALANGCNYDSERIRKIHEQVLL